MKVLFDLNVILDLCLDERIKTYSTTKSVYEFCLKENIELFISSSSIDNLEFILYSALKKTYPTFTNKNYLLIIKNKIEEILKTFKIAKTPSYIDIDYEDIEDSLIIYSAKAIDAFVLTRDEQLIKKYSDICIHPNNFIDFYKTKKTNVISFLDLKKINNQFYEEFEKAFDEVLNSGWYLLGKQNELFEKEFAEYCGVKRCIGVANGLDALILILRAYKEMGIISDGDEVIVPANTYIASILSISQNNLTPVLVEPDLKT